MLENPGGNGHYGIQRHGCLIFNVINWKIVFLKLKNVARHQILSCILGNLIILDISYMALIKKCTEIRVRSRVARSPMAVEYLNNIYVPFFDNQGYDLAFIFFGDWSKIWLLKVKWDLAFNSGD